MLMITRKAYVRNEKPSGSAYRFLLRAVTEAGAGDPPAVSDAPRVVMPIQGWTCSKTLGYA